MAKVRIPEKQVQASIVQLLRTVGGAVYIMGTRRPRGDYHGTCQTPGLPDLLCFLPPRTRQRWVLLFVEVKAQGGRLRPAQRDFRECCINADAAHVVGDLDAVIAWLHNERYLRAEQIHWRPVEATP